MLSQGTKTCLEPVCVMMNVEPSEESMKTHILKNPDSTTKFVKEFDPETIDGERMYYINQCTESPDYTEAKIKNANKGLVPVRNWVVAAEKYGKTFEKNKPIVPETIKNPEPVRTP